MVTIAVCSYLTSTLLYSMELILKVLFCIDLVEAGTLFRKASGIYQHLAENVLPPLKPSLPPDRCPEATASLASIMSIICLAEAQVLF